MQFVFGLAASTLLVLLAVGGTMGLNNFLFGDRSRRQGCDNCILLTQCPELLRRLRTRTRAAIYAVNQAICGYEGQYSKVCCPVGTGEPIPPPKAVLPKSCGFSGDFHRIFGGQETGVASYPWIAALGYIRPGSLNVQFHCAGSLINRRYILTAAHCLDPATLRGRRLVEIRLGDWDLRQDRDCEGDRCLPPFREVFMESAVIHPTYSRRFQYSDDIALIRLTEDLDLEALSPIIHPICLPPAVAPGITAVGEQVLAIGWGMTEGGMLSDRLQQVRLPIVDPERCREVYGPAFGDKQICAGGAEGSDTCAGDSGGPLMRTGPRNITYMQVGVVSFGLAVCGTNNTPAVYTSVSEHRQWIVDNMRP